MIENLETLAALARFGTMLKTGTALRISQSAVSKRIATLEHTYGQKLIERSGKNVVLTKAGTEMVEKVRPLLAEIRGALKAQVIESRLNLVIGVSESLLSSWGAAMLARTAARQKVSIRLHAHRSPVVVDKVNSGEFDLGVCAGSIGKAGSLISELLLREEMVVIRSAQFNKKPASSRPIKVITIEPTSATWKAIRKPISLSPITVDQTLESFFSIAQLARAGVGHALVPIGVARTLSYRKSQLVRFGGKIERPIQLLFRKSRMAKPAFERFVADLHQQAGQTDP